MVFRTPVYIIFCLNFYLVVNEKSLPPYFPICYKDDPDINSCLINATEQIKPYLRKGVPELNIPPISPFFIPEIVFQQGTSAFNYKSTLTDVVLTGLDNYKFTTFQFDRDKMVFSGSVEMGLMNIKGNFSIQGKILSVPVEGGGMLNTNITSSNGSLTQEVKLVTRKGITYLETVKASLKIDIGGDIKSDFSGVFDGNEVIAKAAHDVIEDNLKEIVNELRPAIEEIVIRIMEDVLFKNIFKIPYDKLYPVRN